MVKVLYPITWSAGREGETADVLHEIAEEMLEQRIDLLRTAPGANEVDGEVYRRHAQFFEKYATVLDAISFQLTPERWNPATAGDMLARALVYQIDLPAWMLPEWMGPRPQAEEPPLAEMPGETVQQFDHDADQKDL
jgi:hypothetical protein